MTTRINPALIGKFGLTHAVASNALTLTLTHADGSTISASNPVYAEFPSATLSSALKSVVTITSPITLTIPNGATMGHASGSVCHLFPGLLLNGSTPEMFVTNLPPDYPGTFLGTRLITTTAIDTSSDSATGIYSNSARSNVPWIPVAMCKSTQATAGVWASSLTQVDVVPYRIPTFTFKAYRSAAQLLAHATFTKISFDAEQYDPDSAFDSATNYRYQPRVAGVYKLEAHYAITVNDTNQVVCELYLNGGGGPLDRDDVMAGGSNQVSCKMGCVYPLNGTTDYVEVYAYQATGGSSNLSAGQQLTNFSATRVNGGVIGVIG